MPLDDAIARAKWLFAELGDVRHRKMFGGAGLYADDLMFALIAGDEIYLKVDGAVIDAFRAAGSHPFTYQGKGKPMEMSYWLLPDDAGADPAAAAPWATRSLAAAKRQAKPRRRAKRDRTA